MKKYLLIICLLTGSLTAQAYEVAGGQCGENAFWGLTNDSVFTVYGAGPMYDYYIMVEIPWRDMRFNIKKVIISEGITSVGAFSFFQYLNIEEIEIAGSVESIGTCAFSNSKGLRKLTLSEGIKRFGDGAFSTVSSLLPNPIILPSTTEFIDFTAFFIRTTTEFVCLASVVPKMSERGSNLHFSGSVLYVPKESVDAYKADAIWSQFPEILPLDSLQRADSHKTPVYVDVYVDVYDTIHHRVDIYDTVHTQVLRYDETESELYDYTVVFDTVYKTYKVWVNDYDTITVYATDTIYTDIFYSSNYIHENILVYDTITGYIFEGDSSTGIHSVIQKDETVEIFSIDGHSVGYHRMDNMPGLSPGIYILRSLRTDNRLKIRVK